MREGRMIGSRSEIDCDGERVLPGLEANRRFERVDPEREVWHRPAALTGRSPWEVRRSRLNSLTAYPERHAGA